MKFEYTLKFPDGMTGDYRVDHVVDVQLNERANKCLITYVSDAGVVTVIDKPFDTLVHIGLSK